MLSLVDEMQEMWASPQHKLTAYEAYLEERIALRRTRCTPQLSPVRLPVPDSTACHLQVRGLDAGRQRLHLQPARGEVPLTAEHARGQQPQPRREQARARRGRRDERCGRSSRPTHPLILTDAPPAVRTGLPELSAWARARAEQAAEQALEQESTAKRQRKQRATFWATAVVDTELLSRLTLQC